MWDRILWYIKQLFPLRYSSHYTDDKGKLHLTVWKMFHGECYHVEDYIIPKINYVRLED